MKGISNVKQFCGHPNGCSFAKFATAGSFILIGSDDESSKLLSIDHEELKEACSFNDHRGYINHGDFSYDGKKFATCSNDKTAIVYSLETGKAVSQITHHNFGVSWCTFSPDSAVLCTCSWDNSIALSCAETGRFVGNLLGHRNPVTSADFSISGQLATSSWDKMIRIWDISKGVSCPMSGHIDVVWGVAYSPTNAHVLASVSRDSTTSIWDTRMGGRVATLSDGSVKMNCVTFSPNGEYLVSAGSRSNITLRHPSNLGQQLTHTSGHRGRINSVSFSPCSRFLATAGEDGLVNIWDTTNPVKDDVDDLSNMLNYSDMMGKNAGSAAMGL